MPIQLNSNSPWVKPAPKVPLRAIEQSFNVGAILLGDRLA